MKKNIAIIINPISGTKDKTSVRHELEQNINKDLYDIHVVLTEYAGHAAEIAAAERDKGADVVVAVGGDGTVNEVGRALVDSKTAMAIIPCGSGNGLARHLHIPMDVDKAIEVINGDRVEAIDYGRINELPFFCTCGVGFDAHISMEFAKKGTRGLMTYVKTTISEFFKYKPEKYLLVIDGNEIHCQSFLITVANASQYGNNAYIAPNATLTDGLLDVVIMSPFHLYAAPALAHRMFHKTMEGSSYVSVTRCKHIEIHRERPGSVHFDGEPYSMGKDIDIQIFHQALNVLVPRFI